MMLRLALAILVLCGSPAYAGIELNNDGFSQDGIQRTISAAAQFPAENFTVTWAVYHDAVSATGYKTYVCFCQTTFGGGNEYAVAFAANPNVLGHGQFGIGSQGNDTYSGGDEPAVGRWYYQAFRLRKRGTNDYEQLFYYDLPNLSKVISRDRTAAITPINSTTRLSFGTPPYTTNEGLEGVLANAKVFDFPVPSGELFRQAQTWQVTSPQLKRHLWGQWPMQHTGDLKDISGHGRHLAFTTLTNAVGNRGHAPGAVSWREWSWWWPFDGPNHAAISGCRLLQNGTDKRLTQNGTDGRILQAGGDCELGGGGGPTNVGWYGQTGWH